MDPAGDEVDTLVRGLVDGSGALVAFGVPGSGKTTLVRALAARVRELGAEVAILSADPGQPSFGPPASISLDDPAETSFVGSIDPMAARLTLQGELVRLARVAAAKRPGARLLVDASGLVASAIGREWALRQVEAVAARLAILLERERELDELARVLSARDGVEVVRLAAHPDAKRGGDAERHARRGRALLDALENAGVYSIALAAYPLLGVPERGVREDDWPGRLVGLLRRDGSTAAVARVLAAGAGALEVEAAIDDLASIAALRAGDAAWDDRAKTVIRRPFADPAGREPPGPWKLRPKDRVAASTGDRGKAPGFEVHVAGGLFGDPLVHVRPLHERDAVLIDLGRASQVPIKLLHRVGLVLVSHAHVDHVFGFDELLRALLGRPRRVVIVGPEGIARRLASKLDGYEWNLIEAGLAPVFVVRELDGERLTETELAPASAPRPLGERAAPGGLVHDEPDLRVHATPLAHRGIVSLGFAIDERARLAVRPEALDRLGIEPGPWIDAVKRALAEGKRDEPIALATGTRAAGELADEIFLPRPGQKIAYVTDCADTPDNRARVIELARGADLFICEATFLESDRDRGAATGHLTARAAGELARDAGVLKLIPFHASPRYEHEPERIYAEVMAAFPRVPIDDDMRRRIDALRPVE